MRRFLVLLLLVLAGCSTPQNRDSATEALLRWEDQRIAPTDSLVTFLQDDDAHIRRAAAKCAGRIGRNDVTAQLIQLLEDPSDSVQEQAAIALGFIDNFQSPNKLSARLESSHTSVREAILFSLGNIKGGGQELLPLLGSLKGNEAQTAWNSMRKRVEDVDQGKLDEAVVVGLITHASKPNLLWRVLRCAEKLDSISFENEVIELLQHRDITVRAHACRLLGKSDSPAALVEFAENNLRNSPDHDLVEALRSIGNIGVINDQVEQLLGNAIRNKESHIARTALGAVTAISSNLTPLSGAEERISLLPAWRIKLLNCASDQLLPLPDQKDEPRHPAVRAAAVEACCALRGPGLMNEAIWNRIVLDQDPLVKQSIWRGVLSHCVNNDELGNFTSFIGYGLPVAELLAAVESLGNTSDRLDNSEQIITETLLRVLHNSEPAVISAAAEQLGNFPTEININTLCQVWDEAQNSGSEDIRWSVLTAVQKMSEKSASLSDSTSARVTAMIESGFDSASPRIRKKARSVAVGNEQISAQRIPALESLLLTLPAYKRSPKQPPLTGQFDAPEIICETEYGNFKIELNSDIAPNTCAAILSQLGKKLTFHRVVPGFVIQGGDPDGTGWGGPGYNIRSEWSNLPYLRGTVGIAHSGKDSGGSQFFVALTEQPHLEGRYTVFGKVTSGLKVIDKIQPGDSYKLVNPTDVKP
jgi:cyclophilin family peptidyl-prolyl cis-trans isomerase/HEAT repeat protein